MSADALTVLSLNLLEIHPSFLGKPSLTWIKDKLGAT